jgi:hypothetical protein
MLNSEQTSDNLTFEHQLKRFIALQQNKVHKSVDVASGVFDLKKAVTAQMVKSNQSHWQCI